MSALPSLPARHRISFPATSNNVTVTEAPVESGSDLRAVLSKSKVFTRAFRDKGDNGDTFASLSRQPRKESNAIIIQSSKANVVVHSAPYGLVSAFLRAYNEHHNLVIRPDDVWQAILTQFSFYVNANAEQLRDKFVDFKGKKTLVVEAGGSLFTADFGAFANRMVDEQIATNIKDPEVAEWLLPKFSTTETSDRVAASVTIMSTLQAYFEYVCCLACGIPQVTLEGTVDDWRVLRQKIDRLPTYDLKEKEPLMAKWHSLLAKVLDSFVKSAEGNPDLHFWDTICSHSGGGSGPSYISGWATVFACFTDKGEWLGNIPDEKPNGRRRLVGGTPPPKPEWPFIDTSQIPIGAVSVPVLVDDNGVQYETYMLAGQFAYEMTSLSGRADGGSLDTVRPRSDWCIAYEGKPKEDQIPYRAGEIKTTKS